MHSNAFNMRTFVIVVLIVFAFVCGHGVYSWICPGLYKDCEDVGFFPGVKRTWKTQHTKDGLTRFFYFYCDDGSTLNISPDTKFECCWNQDDLAYYWRAYHDVTIIPEDESVKCEKDRVECTNSPPLPAPHMERTEVSRFRPGNHFFNGDVLKYECEDGFERVESEDDVETTGDYYDDLYADYNYDIYVYDDCYDNATSISAPQVVLTSLLTCSKEGEWIDADTNSSDVTIGFCREIICDASRFENMTDGMIVDWKPNYRYGEYLELSCDPGYMPKDRVDTVLCLNSCSFSENNHKDFECTEIKCPKPPIIANGGAYDIDRYVNGSVSFGCHKGYTLEGQETWRCLENGEWDGYCTKCNRKDTYCPTPCVPEGATLVNPMTVYPRGALINFTCDSDVIYGGSQQRECLTNRQWSGDDIDCVGLTIRRDTVSNMLTALHNVKLKANPKKDVRVSGKTIDTNQAGGVDVFLMVDLSGSITKDEFDATKNFIKTLIAKLSIGHGPSETRLQLYLFASDVYVIGDHLGRNGGMKPLGEEEWMRIDDLKQEDVQKIIKKGTKFYFALRRVKLELLGKTKAWAEGSLRIAQQVLIIISDGRDNGGGDTRGLANILKDDFELEIYSICIQPKKKRSILGRILMESLASPDKEDNDKHFFPLTVDNNSDDLSKIAQMMINEGERCVDCGCTNPLLTNYKNAAFQLHSDAKRNAWPWMVQITKGNSHFCGGSVIHKRWILTAAHCKEDYSHYDVNLKRLKLDDDKYVQNIPIQDERWVVHSKYKPDKAPTYLYDIALIHLPDPLVFDETLHSVCLGELNDTNYEKYLRSGQYGVATGWGRTKASGGDLAKHLKQMQMMVQADVTCINMDEKQRKNDNEALLFDPSVMFCAGGKDNDGSIIDTGSGDAGGPFVVPFDETVKDKKDHFLQTGIISNSIGKAFREDGYGVYTKLTPELLQWIREEMKKKE